MDRETAIEWLEDVGGELGRVYWEEAEHQHGAYFSEMFGEGSTGMDDLQEDFATFVMSTDSRECDVCGHHRGYFDADEKLRCGECDEVQPF